MKPEFDPSALAEINRRFSPSEAVVDGAARDARLEIVEGPRIAYRDEWPNPMTIEYASEHYLEWSDKRRAETGIRPTIYEMFIVHKDDPPLVAGGRGMYIGACIVITCIALFGAVMAAMWGAR